MTKSTGQRGLIFLGSPPILATASLIAARSTTAGTPVKSWRMTLAGLNGIQICLGAFFYQSKIFSTSFEWTSNSSQFLIALSNNTLTLQGRLLSLGSLRLGKLQQVTVLLPRVSFLAIFSNGFGLDLENLADAIKVFIVIIINKQNLILINKQNSIPKIQSFCEFICSQFNKQYGIKFLIFFIFCYQFIKIISDIICDNLRNKTSAIKIQYFDFIFIISIKITLFFKILSPLRDGLYNLQFNYNIIGQIYKSKVQMIEQIWNKKIVTIIQMNEQDIADDQKPLPLITQLSWNAYIGFYDDLIIDYYQMFAPFPFNRQQFNLTLKHTGFELQPSTIVYHIFQQHNISFSDPLVLQCNFRTRKQPKNIDLRRHFKNNLKASTAIRYGKYGASILMVQMSINNVQNMLTSFPNMDYRKFLGSDNFQSDDLGYLFLIHRAEKIAVKFIYEDIIVQRGSDKTVTFAQFVSNLFGTQQFKKYGYKIHMFLLTNLQIKMQALEKYCHPDGYLYIHLVCVENQQNKI